MVATKTNDEKVCATLNIENYVFLKHVSIFWQQLKFPRSVFVIFIIHFVSKFSELTFRGTLPLYFVEKLEFNENEATITFHALQIILYTSSLVGGLLADSVFGIYKVIHYSISLSGLGLIILTVALITPLHLPLTELTFLALAIFNIGFGALAPCVYTFGGDQFEVPQQEKQLSLFFVLIYTVTNIASLLSVFFSPILRKDIRCFGELSCYSLVFAAPTCFIFIAVVTLFFTKRLYRIRKTEDNIVIVKIVRCMIFALSRKLKSKEKKEHWLDHASEKYEIEFINDIKSLFQTFFLFLPFIMPSALYAAEATTMTFQASKMNGDVFGYLIKPDQIHIFQAVFAIVALPAIHYYVYPVLERYCRVNTPLRKLTLSLTIAALSYYLAAFVELNLETTYARKPTENNAQIRIYNTLNCNATMTIDEQKFTVQELHMWENLDIMVTGKRVLKYNVELEQCERQQLLYRSFSGDFEVFEKQSKSLALTENGFNYEFIDNNEKSLSGNPLIRALIHRNTNDSENNMALTIKMKNEILSEIPIHENITRSEFFEVVHGTYDVYLNDKKMQSDVPLKVGGVYTFLGHISNSSKVVNLVTVTPPNSMHLLWIVPQQILLYVALITIDAVGTDFTYSQSPSSMKAFMQAYWLYLLLFGHLTVVLVTEANFFERKVFVFLLYAVLMTIATIIFALLAKSYKYRRISKDDDQKDNAE